MECPKVLKISYYKLQSFEDYSARIVKDYELDYYLSGNRTLFIDNKKFVIEPNTLILKRPGQVVFGVGELNCYMLTLDFSRTKDSSHYKRNSPGEIQELSSNPLLNNVPVCLMPQHNSEIKKLLQFLSIYPDKSKKGEFDSVVMELLCLIFADSHHSADNASFVTDDLAYICRYMQKHYNENLTIEDLAEKIHLNKSYFIRKFKSKFGVSPNKYLLDIKLSNAKILLKDTNLSIEEIAVLSGFYSSSYFSSIFKREFETTPGNYRKSFMDSII